MDSTGVEEFSCGALCDANSRLGRRPGDPDSTDPDAEIQQIYTQAEASGGFLHVTIASRPDQRKPAASFDFYDERGQLLHQSVKRRDDDMALLGDQAPGLLREHLLKKIDAQYLKRRQAVESAQQSPAKLKERQRQLRTRVRQILGELPTEKTPLQANVTGVISGDGFRIEKVVYESRPNFYVTANLFLPTTGQGPYPAVLIACGHSRFGKAYEPYQRVAMLMAREGFVAMTYDPIGQGERILFAVDNPNAGLQHKLANVNSIILSAEQDYKDIRFTRKTFREVQAAYRLLGYADRIDMFAYDDKHSFSQPRREMATQWMRRWLLDDPKPNVTEPELETLPIEVLQVTRSGQVLQEFPAALTIADLNQQLASRIQRQRRRRWDSLDLDSARQEIRQTIRVPRAAAMPKLEVDRRGWVNRGTYRVEKLVLRRNGEVPVAALLFRSHIQQLARPFTIYVDGRGKATDAGAGGPIQQRLLAGHDVLSIDVRGWGEMAEPPSSIVYAEGDHVAAMLSLHLGEPLLGQRVVDVLTALDFLVEQQQVEVNRIHLVGIQRAGPVVLHAAALKNRLGSVTVRDSILDWEAGVIGRPLDMSSISHVVPGALLKYDLPDLQ